MTSFAFAEITASFVETLADLVLGGNSALLIAPRRGGKSAVLDELEVCLRKETQSDAICRIDLREQGAGRTEGELCKLLADKMPVRLGQQLQQPFSSVDRVFDALSMPIVLLASNVDDLPPTVAQSFLRALEQRIELRTISAVMTAVSDIRDLLGGIKNEFRSVQRFVLQRYGRDEFERRVREFIKRSKGEFRDGARCIEFLLEQTGGSLYLANLALKRILDASATDSVRIDYKAVKAEIKLMSRDLTWRDQAVLHSIIRISQTPSSCKDLEILLQENSLAVPASTALAAPHVLELAGVARRELFNGAQASIAGDSVRLTFSSPLARSFTESHFDKIRIADLYALSGDWASAIERYKEAPAEERIRPRNVYDHLRADNMVKALSLELHRCATEKDPVAAVDALFIGGCRYVLGFPETSRFSWRPDIVPRDWHVTHTDLGADEAEALRRSLPTGDQLTSEALERKFQASAVAFSMRGQHPRETVVVAVSDYKTGAHISPVRRQLLKVVIDHYKSARQHAATIEADRWRNLVLEQYRHISRFIGRSLQEQKMDVTEVLKVVAERIMQLGYGLFAAGYYDRNADDVICGIYRRNSDSGLVLSDQWPNEQVARDHLRAARVGSALRSQDEEGNEVWILPIGRTIVANDNTERVASEVTHTFSVRRGDGQPLSDQERDDITDFGHQLLEAIEESERIILLQSALNHLTEPVAAVDNLFRLRYFNPAMQKIFGFPNDISGQWHSPTAAVAAGELFSGLGCVRVLELLLKSLGGEEHTEQVLAGLGEVGTYFGRVKTGPIHNSRERVIGSYIYVHDFSEFKSVLETINQLFSAVDMDGLYTTLLSVGSSGEIWRRLYRVDPKDPAILVGVAAKGPKSEEYDDFIRGKIPVIKGAGAEPVWQCFEKKTPIVFQHGSQDGNGRTQFQVPIERVPCPPWKGYLAKEPGEMWLDIPLIGRKPVGLLSMSCDDSIRPEYLEMWRVVGGAAGFAIENREREEEGKQNAALAAERVFLAATAHNLNTRLASLSPVKYRYEIFAQRNRSAKIADITEHFHRVLSNLQDVLSRAQSHLGTLRIEPSDFDLCVSLRQTMAESLSANQQELVCAGESCKVRADKTMIESLFHELLINSKDATQRREDLKVRIHVEPFLSSQTKWIRILYRDNGPGIPAPMKKRIFDLFFSHRTNGTVGTGLGLYHAQRIAIAHRGRIEEIGKPGSGALFKIEIPERFESERS